VAGFVAASCTSLPRGAGLAAYRTLTRGFNALPDRGMWLTNRVLDRTLPAQTRLDFGAGGYAFDAQDTALGALSVLDLLAALERIRVPIWFINGQWDQLRLHERLFLRLAHNGELLVVPRTTHLVTAMRPDVFNALLGVAIATLEET
jgi:non-heme chloroperoxidase